ncbi:hypothetical protein [Oscillibacter sp.]|uniref:hypothetical protein n=1 Tax=Oscillibacter sp. TaxID=1945593 RepID=UPI0028A10C9F|nr:hypothetical protein [Oscillibacter sp.]
MTGNESYIGMSVDPTLNGSLPVCRWNSSKNNVAVTEFVVTDFTQVGKSGVSA